MCITSRVPFYCLITSHSAINSNLSVRAFVDGYLGCSQLGTIRNLSYTKCSHTEHVLSFLLCFPESDLLAHMVAAYEKLLNSFQTIE